MLKVVVDRLTWHRGKGPLLSALLTTHEGKKCCMGFACNALGYEDTDILDKQGICSLYEAQRRAKSPRQLLLPPDWLTSVEPNYILTSAVVNVLYYINDNSELTDSEREAQLIEQGIKANIQFEFIN